ncbi:MAG: hypothetical protein ACREDF_07585 [Thermoplasmata archaeon]
MPADGRTRSGETLRGWAGEPPAARFGDRDVAEMIARYTGASLGLLAFAVTSVAGLVTGNPVTVTLSRSLFALFVFCLIGLVLGGAAQLVVTEYERNRESALRRPIGGAAPGGPANPAEPPTVTVDRTPESTG